MQLLNIIRRSPRLQVTLHGYFNAAELIVVLRDLTRPKAKRALAVSRGNVRGRGMLGGASKETTENQ